jgi:hypothetical protein
MINAQRILMFLKAGPYQADLFAEQVPIAGYTDSAGRTHAPTVGMRRKHHAKSAAPAPTPARAQAAPMLAASVQVRPASLDDFSPDAIVERAMEILEAHLSARREGGDVMDRPEVVKKYLKLKLAEYPHEVFAALWLDNRHRVIKFSEMFRGTIDGASVHPREVVRDAIGCNAAAVIFAHNHPSGVSEPSQSDLRITQRLKDALAVMDVRVLYHMIVGEGPPVSMSERGIL